jgi:hypothetical protein
MATYQDNPPQYFPLTIPNNSVPDVAGYYVTVTDTGTTNIFRKSKSGGVFVDTKIGEIPKKGTFVPASGGASTEETQYFSGTLNATNLITNQAVPVVNRGIGGVAGGGNSKINDILGTNLAAIEPAPSNLETLNLSESIQAKTVRNSYGPYYYPLDLKTNENGQDIIKFTMRDAPSVEINPNLNAEKSIKRIPSNILGSVFLPVQPIISDNNAVNWSGLSLNALEAYAVSESLSLMSEPDLPSLMTSAGAKLGKAFQRLKENRAALGAGANVYLAQEALGLQGLLSRTTGAVLNPNLELLFQGPQLRPFSFTFRMSPRSAKEAQQVRSIIRFFKQGMAVRETNTIFLKSPHVFDIKYMLDGSNTDHPSINRIKTCALINCNVNYTPDGSYMTFNDSLRTMTSYEITLQFSELEPIFESDYKDIADDEIGF